MGVVSLYHGKGVFGDDMLKKKQNHKIYQQEEHLILLNFFLHNIKDIFYMVHKITSTSKKDTQIIVLLKLETKMYKK